MRFIHSFDNMFLFSNRNVTHMNVSKQYNENRGVRALITKRKHQINLPPSSNVLQKMVPLTGTVPLTYFMGYSESILWVLVFENTIMLPKTYPYTMRAFMVLPMVPLPISFKVLPMIPLVLPLVPMVMPMVPLALPMVPLVPLVSQWYHW